MPRMTGGFGSVVLALLWIAPPGAARGQGPGGDGRGGPGGPTALLVLLDSPAVREEIGLDAKQAARIAAARARVAEKRQAIMPTKGDAAPVGGAGASKPAVDGAGEGEADRGRRGPRGVGKVAARPGDPGPRGGFVPPPELMAAVEELKAAADAADAEILDEILKVRQVRRLRQIDFQRQGPLAILRPEVARKLKLDREQLAQLQGLLAADDAARAEQREALREQFRVFRGPDGFYDQAALREYWKSPEGTARQQAARDRVDRAQGPSLALIARVLTKAQRAALDELRGRPFDLATLAEGRGAPVADRNPAGTTTNRPAPGAPKREAGTAAP